MNTRPSAAGARRTQSPSVVGRRSPSPTWEEIAFYLTDEPRRRVLRAYEAFIARKPGGKGSAPRSLIRGACSAIRRLVLGEDVDLLLPLGSKDLHGEDEDQPC